jgi:acyl dehydratase
MKLHSSMPALPVPLPPLNAATLLRALFKRPRRQSGQPTPRTRFVLERIDTAQLQRYRDALGFAGDAAPLTWWYLPAQRAQVATMLIDTFPFRLPGTVHTANMLRAHAAPDLDAPLLLSTSVTVQPPADNGAVLALLDTVGEQDGRSVFECRSTYLMVRGQKRQGRPSRPLDAPLPAQAGWQVGRACGRRYAALSGDWNPIHLWPWSARLMGMRQPIVHGMHSLGRACAELERLHGRPVTLLDARFRAPVPLGSALALGSEAGIDAGAGRFTVERGGRIAVGGRFALAATAAAPVAAGFIR